MLAPIRSNDYKLSNFQILIEIIHMIPLKFAPMIFSFLLSVMMSCVVSGVSTYSAIGMSKVFFDSWMSSWLKSWVVAFPTILFIAPLTKKLVQRLTSPPK